MLEVELEISYVAVWDANSSKVAKDYTLIGHLLDAKTTGIVNGYREGQT